ncbi:TPA: fimbrial biogenesis outer membrane usher protein [Providencia stuartii]|nr:fimbrial biogenesis outer membrane usher protein [Providencia stuartii]
MNIYSSTQLIDSPCKKITFHYLPLTFALYLVVSPLSAEDYFDPAFLGEGYNSTAIDLSVFSNKGGVADGEYTVTVFVNQREVGVYSLTFKKNTQGEVSPLLTPDLLKQWGVNVEQVPELKHLLTDSKIDNLATYIPQAATKLDLARLSLNVSIPQIAMQSNYGNWADPNLWDEGIPALLTNYNFSAGRSVNTYSQEKAHNQNLFASFLMGANAGAWRLRSNLTYTQNRNSGGNQKRSHDSQTHFSNTYLSRDIKVLRSTLQVGETNTGGEIIDGIPFTGMKLSSDEQMLPNQLRGFAPEINGVANSNSRLTVRQNGNIVYETYVAPGPFSINDIQQSGMSGDYQVTITEADGAERQFIVPYSSLPVMLRPGGWKYELSAGRYNGNLTTQSRDTDFTLLTGVYGLPKDVTLYAGTLLSKDYQAGSGGFGVSLGDVGALSFDITHSSAAFEHESKKTGQSYRLRYSKSLLSTGTSVDLTALRYSTENFYTFNEFNFQGYQLSQGVSPWTAQRRRNSFQTQLSQQMDNWGSLSFRANRDDYWGSDRTLTGLSLGYSNNLKGINYNINYNIDRVKDSQGNWPENRQVSLSVSIPLSLFSYSPALQSVYATTSISNDNHGRTQSQMGFSGNITGTNINYNVSQNWGNKGQVANSNANVGYSGSKGTLSTGYSYNKNSRSININGSGGALVHSEGITFSNTLGDSVALISAPNAYGVTVNNGNSITNSQGYAVAPYLSTYTRNSVGLDPSTLPENVELEQSNINVYPTKGAVVKASFKTRVGYQILMTLTHNKENIPFGAIASLTDANQDEQISAIVGDRGQVYLTGLPESGELLVKWGTESQQQCRVHFNLNKIALQPNIVIHQAILPCESDKQI